MSTFPSVNIPEHEKDDQWVKDYLDAVIQYFETRSERKVRIQNAFHSYNGQVSSITKKLMVKKYGSELSTDFVSYKLGRSKLGVLKGEFLDIDLNTNVHIVNPDGIEERIKKANYLRGASHIKGDLEGLRNAGIKPLNGIDIPDPNDPNLEEKINPKVAVEKSMQAIIDDKIYDLKLKLDFLQNFVQLLLVAETHGYVFRNKNGIDDYMPISADKAIYQENENDPLCEKSPYHGHLEWMYPEDILSTWPDMPSDSRTQVRDLNNQLADSDHAMRHKMIGGKAAFPVYIIEFRVPEKVVRKTSPKAGSDVPYRVSLDARHYDKNKKKIENDVSKGRYEVEVKYKDTIWGGVRVSQDIYFELGKKDNVMYTMDANGKYSMLSNYVHVLYDTVDTERLSINDLIVPLSNVYDNIMFAIVSEIRKLKGKVFVYDEAYKPRLSSMKSVFYDMVEHSAIRINSAQDGNYGEKDIQNAANIISELDLGLSQSFSSLLGLKTDIEQTMDRITGINEAREGGVRPTMSATGAVQNLEASRSATRDLYFFMDEFVNQVLTKLAEKTKTNDAYLKNKKSFKYSSKVVKFLQISKDIPFNNYSATINNGKTENEIKERVRSYFPQEINAGNIRTLDIIKFEREKNFEAAMEILEKGYAEVQQFLNVSNQQKSEDAQADREHALELSRENREDVQQHEKELVILKGEVDEVKDKQKGELKIKDTQVKQNMN